MFVSYGELCSEYYNRSKPIGYSIMGDLEFYGQILEGSQGKILEAGVGTGRLLIPLLERGLDLEGLDYSQEMLDICRANLGARGLEARLYQEDLLELALVDRYEAIIMPTGSFCLIENGELVLKNFYAALKEGGRLVLDLSLPNNWDKGSIKTYSLDLGQGQGIILEDRAIEIDYIEQSTLNYLKYEKYEEGRLIATELQDFKLFFYGIREFKYILEGLGFRDIKIYRDYQGELAPGDDFQILTFSCRK